MKKIILSFSLLLFATSAFAVDEFYSISRSVRALGMGGAFYGLSDDQDALFYNPAGLANYRGGNKGMFSLGADVSGPAFSADGQLLGGAPSKSQLLSDLASFPGQPVYNEANVTPFFFLSKNFAISVIAADPKTQVALLGTNLDTAVDVTAISDTGVVVGFARSFIEDSLHLGINLKGIFRVGGYKQYSILDLVQPGGISINPQTLGGAGFGIDGDLGAIYDVPNLPFGLLNQVSLTFTNLLATNFQMITIPGYGAPPGLDRMVSVGFHSVFPGVGVIDNFHVLLDLAEFDLGGESDPNVGARDGSFFKHVNMGVEVPFNGWFVARAGLHQGDWTLGVGLRTFLFDLDLATYTEELFLGLDRLNSQRYALRMSFGAGAPPPPPIYVKPTPLPDNPKQITKSVETKVVKPVDEKKVEKPLEPNVEEKLMPPPEPKTEVRPLPKKDQAPAWKPDPLQKTESKPAELTTKPKPDEDRFQLDKAKKDSDESIDE